MLEFNERMMKKQTEEYWEALRRNANHRVPVWRKYVDGLLPLEMACMAAKGRLSQEPCQTLVLLVGQSVEPLLQSVWAHNPEKLLLILNRQYDEETTGEDFGHTLCELLSQLPSDRCVSDAHIHQETVEPRPADVFRKLVEQVRDRENVVIDITGAKKSMVAGAFLYAAYADVPVSYIDFDDAAYSTKYGKPYGYASHIRLFENPYTAFALRDWERVRRFYRRYKFRDARLLLSGNGNGGPGTVLTSMTKYLPGSELAVNKLIAVLHCYELWDAGDYNQAANHANQIACFKPPAAVSLLGGKWFTVKDARFEGGLPDFYDDTPEFRAYVYDEMARIERLIKYNRDYRSAFLRAGSLNEIVMLSRLVKMVSCDSQRSDLLKSLQHRTPNARRVFEVLLKPPGTIFQIDKDIRFWGAPDIQVTVTESMHPWWKGTDLFNGECGWDVFIKRRNDLAHKYFSVPLTWAEDALRFVRLCVADLWGPDPGTVDTEAMKWSELCRFTGLEQYLPPNLCAEEKKKEKVQ